MRRFALAGVTGFVGLLLIGDRATAENREFIVMLAHSPKSFAPGGVPGLPPDGLFNREIIERDYFDTTNPLIDSFAEYWKEISYGDVTVTGEARGWVSLPWAFEPSPPNAAPRPSPADFIDLRTGDGGSEDSPIAVPAPFAYGAGEGFCDARSSLDADAISIDSAKCGALIILDILGNANDPNAPDPRRGIGMVDSDVVAINVWTPGERFLDVDEDNRWDGVDEKNDRMCHGPNGCRNICRAEVCNLSGASCTTSADCPPGESCVVGGSEASCGGFCEMSRAPCATGAECSPGESCEGDHPPCPTGETCGDPVGSGPRGCGRPGCGDLEMGCIDWNANDQCENDDADCPVATPIIACRSNDQCPDRDNSGESPGECSLAGFCLPTNCFAPGADGDATLPPCCENPDTDPADCINGNEGITCGDPVACCEFVDFNGDSQVDVVEPFEDYMIRWNATGRTPATVWVPVTEEYVRNNYPGDVEELVRRTGNGYYDSPDLFFDVGNTKMMQDAGPNQFAWRTPKPGTRYSASPVNEQSWFDDFWSDRYDSSPPPWPGGSGPSPAFNSPRMRPFDPANPVPPTVRGAEGRRWFKANRGGWNGFGRGTAEDRGLDTDLGTDNLTDAILPEEVFGYYDGWVEHDDLASSRYHREGDKRLGEITSPGTDSVNLPSGGVGGTETYTAIFGADLGRHNPAGGAANADPDFFGVAAGPRAFNIHGSSGFDAGDVCIVEWLTWRTDGQHQTTGNQWEVDNGNYHPFAGPSSPLSGGPVGFRDYNLDGMIDQGEVRPELSENYSVDSDPFTLPDLGSATNYPWNRRRLVEDVVEALDPSVDWDLFADTDLGGGPKVSGIVLVPPGAYSNVNRFPFNPRFFSIDTQDRSDLSFHDLVTCQDCRSFPSAVEYAAHEYLHTWEGYPDLYDYDILDDPPTDVENCPIGNFDIMASGSGANRGDANPGLVHSVPILKETSGWIEAVDLRSLLTPGVESTLLLPPAEFVRDESYFFLENDARLGERYYFWSAGSGFDQRFPGSGMLILHTDVGANPEALPLQQRTSPFVYLIVQADGRNDLEACTTGGNSGDAGDLWPGSTNATRFNRTTVPPATWNSFSRWTGLDINDIAPDGFGSVRLTLTLIPTNIPSLRFIDPPGGVSVNGIYQVRFEATDVHGLTTIRLYYTDDLKFCNGSGASCDGNSDCPNGQFCRHHTDLGSTRVHLIGTVAKSTPGTSPMSANWRLSGVDDGRYVLFAKLAPGSQVGESEVKFTTPVAGRNNVGNGSLLINEEDVAIDDDFDDTDDFARSETWTAVCIDADGTEWRVNSSLSQPVPATTDVNQDPFPHAFTSSKYTSIGNEVAFLIQAGPKPFTLGDRFTFTTTGITGVSKSVTVTAGRITDGPIAIAFASPLSGLPPLDVSFDGRDSSDPSGEPLQFRWQFGDGSTDATGAFTSHRYVQPGSFTANLRVTNPTTGRFDVTNIDITVINNSPNAAFSVDRSSGGSPLQVAFDASATSDPETAANALIYQWDFGDGSSANAAGTPGLAVQTTHVYRDRQDGTPCTLDDSCLFNATLTVTDAGGKTDTATRQIIVGNTAPVAKVTVSPIEGPAPLAVRFNAISSDDEDGDELTVDWDWDDGTTQSNVPLAGDTGDGVVVHQYTEAGEFSPSAIIRDTHGGSATWAEVTIIVTGAIPQSSIPRASFDIDPPSAVVSVGDPIFVDGSTSRDRPAGDPNSIITRWTWNWGDGTPQDQGVQASHIYGSTGVFVITLTVEDADGNTNTSILTVSVVDTSTDPTTAEGDPPVVVLMIQPDPPEGFAGVTVFSFDARGSTDPDGDDLTYRWDLGDGTLDNRALVPRHIYELPGTYVVRLTVRDETNREATRTQEVVIASNDGNRAPFAFIATGPRTGAAPVTLTFDGRNSFDLDDDELTFTWEFRQDGTLIATANGEVIDRLFDLPGVFSVELIVSDGRGASDRAGPITVTIAAGGVGAGDGGTGQPVPGDTGTVGTPICGLGMLMSLFGSLIGLTGMRLRRRRR